MTRPYHQYFGLTSLAITIVSLALTIALMTGSAVSSLPGAIAGNVLMTFLKLVFLVAVLMIAVVAVYYLVVNGMLGDRRRSFSDIYHRVCLSLQLDGLFLSVHAAHANAWYD